MNSQEYFTKKSFYYWAFIKWCLLIYYYYFSESTLFSSTYKKNTPLSFTCCHWSTYDHLLFFLFLLSPLLLLSRSLGRCLSIGFTDLRNSRRRDNGEVATSSWMNVVACGRHYTKAMRKDKQQGRRWGTAHGRSRGWWWWRQHRTKATGGRRRNIW